MSRSIDSEVRWHLMLGKVRIAKHYADFVITYEDDGVDYIIARTTKAHFAREMVRRWNAYGEDLDAKGEK